MSDELEDVFGEDFAKGIQERTAERRQERNRVTEEQLAQICSLAINDNKFDPNEGDPRFSFTTENGITHDVLLMQVPDPQAGEVWEHLSEPWEGAARLPLEYLGRWYWCTFPQKEDASKLEQGMYVIVVGDVEETEADSGDKYYNIYPVRGIATLEQAQKYAEMVLSEEGFDEEDEDTKEEFSEPTSEDVEEVVEESDDDGEEEETESSSSAGLEFSGSSSSEDDSDDSSGGLSSMIDDDEEEEQQTQESDETKVPYEDIASIVEQLAENQDDDEEPQVYEIEEGSEHHKRLTQVVMKRVDGIQNASKEQVAEVIIDVIDEHRTDEEEEEEDDDEMDTLF